MSKKIVIVPTFCESHLIKHQIPNIIDTVDPDYIVINEGMFPNGTEGNKNITSDWLQKYTLNGEGKRGFDFPDLEKIVVNAKWKYPDVKFILNEMDYSDCNNSTECYKKATTNFEELEIDIEEGDYIFPYEGDVFHHESTASEIKGYLEQIQPGEGFRSTWIDYMQNFWYVEKSRIKIFLKPEKYNHKDNTQCRRICFRYDKDGIKYKKMLDNFMTVTYHDPVIGYGMLYPTELMTYHYAWIRPGKFRDLRCDQLARPEGYWDKFKSELDKCDEYKYEEICVREAKRDLTHGWVKFFSHLPHPKHIKDHELWTDLDQDTIDKLTNYY